MKNLFLIGLVCITLAGCESIKKHAGEWRDEFVAQLNADKIAAEKAEKEKQAYLQKLNRLSTSDLRRECGHSEYNQLVVDKVTQQRLTKGRLGDSIKENRVYVGMPAWAAKCSWGKPEDIERISTIYGSQETWMYHCMVGYGQYCKIVTVSKGQVIAISD